MHRYLHSASPMHIPNPGPGEQREVSGQSLSVSVLSGSGGRDGSGLTEPCLGGGAPVHSWSYLGTTQAQGGLRLMSSDVGTCNGRQG